MMFPSLFISHGAPNELLKDSNVKRELERLGKTLRLPKYIIIVSAHYVTKELKIANIEAKGQIFDFYGFEEELYDFEYKIKSDKTKALELLTLLKKSGFKIEEDFLRESFDHGVWSLLAMMYKKLEVPVIQLSLPSSYEPSKLMALGEVLGFLKDEAMIIASGGITHNLGQMSLPNRPKDYAINFTKEVKEAVLKKDDKSVLSLVNSSNFYINHPTNEHFMPLYIAYGSAKNKEVEFFNDEIVLSNISMLSMIFDKE